MLTNDTLSQNAGMFKAFCDETRLIILEQLREGTLCACELLENLNISQPALSKQMKTLIEAGIVTSRRDGKKILYSLNYDTFLSATEYIQSYLQLIPTKENI